MTCVEKMSQIPAALQLRVHEESRACHAWNEYDRILFLFFPWRIVLKKHRIVRTFISHHPAEIHCAVPLAVCKNCPNFIRVESCNQHVGTPTITKKENVIPKFPFFFFFFLTRQSLNNLKPCLTSFVFTADLRLLQEQREALIASCHFLDSLVNTNSCTKHYDKAADGWNQQSWDKEPGGWGAERVRVYCWINETCSLSGTLYFSTVISDKDFTKKNVSAHNKVVTFNISSSFCTPTGLSTLAFIKEKQV